MAYIFLKDTDEVIFRNEINNEILFDNYVELNYEGPGGYSVGGELDETIEIPAFDQEYGLIVEVWAAGRIGETMVAGSTMGAGDGGNAGDYMRCKYTGSTTEFRVVCSQMNPTHNPLGSQVISFVRENDDGYIAVSDQKHTQWAFELVDGSVVLQYEPGGVGGSPYTTGSDYWSGSGAAPGSPDGTGQNGANAPGPTAPYYNAEARVGYWGNSGRGTSTYEFSAGHPGYVGTYGCGGGGAVKSTTIGQLGGYGGPGRVRIRYKIQ